MTSKYKVARKTEFLDKIQKRAYELEKRNHGCAQCTLLAIQEAFGLEDKVLFKAASGLAGGIAQMHSACGALTGGIMALGLKYGRERADLEGPGDIAQEKLQPGMEPAGKLYKWFEREFGSVICSEVRKKLNGIDLFYSVPWQKELAEELGFHENCSELVGKTARRVAELLMNEE